MRLGDSVMVLAAGGPPGLLPAREQMAVSLGWHIILACFGVAFPTMIFVMHRRGIVRDDPDALRSSPDSTLARCSSHSEPTISRALGPRWPNSDTSARCTVSCPAG